MSRLFDGYDIEEAEGVPVQYVGVYLLKWREHPEHPTMAFVESKYTTEMFDELLAACETFLRAWQEPHRTGHTESAFHVVLRAVANVKGE